MGINSLDASLVTLAEAFAFKRGVSLWRVGHMAANRGSFFIDLRSQKRHCQTNTYEHVLQWFSEHWPEDLEWPETIPRPNVQEYEPEAGAINGKQPSRCKVMGLQ